MKTIRVVAAVIRDKDKIFATARGYGEFKGGWEFPGGKIEEGETPQEALVREIKEELEKIIAQYQNAEVVARLREKLVPGDMYYEDIKNRLAYRKTVDMFWE